MQLAKLIYVYNDERARVKRGINLRASSKFIEEKQCAPCAFLGPGCDAIRMRAGKARALCPQSGGKGWGR